MGRKARKIAAVEW